MSYDQNVGVDLLTVDDLFKGGGLILLFGFVLRFYAMVWLMVRSIQIIVPRVEGISFSAYLFVRALGIAGLLTAIYLFHNSLNKRVAKEDYVKWFGISVPVLIFLGLVILDGWYEYGATTALGILNIFSI